MLQQPAAPEELVVDPVGAQRVPDGRNIGGDEDEGLDIIGLCISRPSSIQISSYHQHIQMSPFNRRNLVFDVS